MQTANNDKVIDFNSFKQQQPQPEEGAAVQFKPMLVWYPMWVMVPDHTPATPNS